MPRHMIAYWMTFSARPSSLSGFSKASLENHTRGDPAATADRKGTDTASTTKIDQDTVSPAEAYRRGIRT